MPLPIDIEPLRIGQTRTVLGRKFYIMDLDWTKGLNGIATVRWLDTRAIEELDLNDNARGDYVSGPTNDNDECSAYCKILIDDKPDGITARKWEAVCRAAATGRLVTHGRNADPHVMKVVTRIVRDASEIMAKAI